jgi:hypothetical protein
MQAILYGELGSRRCESEVVLVHVHSFVGSEESTTTVWTAGNEFCLSHQNKIWMFGSGLVQLLCELACFVISQNSMKLRCHPSTSQNT